MSELHTSVRPHICVNVQRTSTCFHIFELEIEMPKFAMYATVEKGSIAESTSNVTFTCGGKGGGGRADKRAASKGPENKCALSAVTLARCQPRILALRFRRHWLLREGMAWRALP